MHRKLLAYALLLLISSAFIFTAGCGANGKRTEPNTVSTFFYGGSRFEATVRELTVSGRKAEARIRIINVGGYSVDTVQAEAMFLDAAGNLLYTDQIDLSGEPFLAGDSKSVTVSCSGKKAKAVDKVILTGKD